MKIFYGIRNELKIGNIAAFFVLTAVVFAVLTNSSGCGIINIGGDLADGQDLTFASKNNYERNDIVVDGMENIKPSKENTGNKENKNDNIGQTEETLEIPQVDEQNHENPAERPKETTENQIIYGPVLPIIPEATETLGKTPLQDGTVRLSFLAAGDNIMHSNMIDDAKEHAKNGEIFNFTHMYRNIADTVKAADIALVNVETPIAGDEFAYSGYPMFNTPKENGFALVDIGFDIVNIANNHMLDKWEKGYMNHIEFWEKQNVLMIGGFKDQNDFERVRIYEKDGVSIAFLSYTYGTNGMFLPKESKMVIPFIDSETVERQVKAARPLADLLFVVMHWGDEDQFAANQAQRSLAQIMVDNGVDVIIGMHPHVFQETKWVNRPDGKQTLIAYSIGNLISGMLGAKNMVGGFLTFDIVKTTVNGKSETTIEKARIDPVVTHHNMRRKEFEVYRFEDYTEALAKNHGVINSDNKFSYKYLKDVIVKNIDPEFLSDFYKN